MLPLLAGALAGLKFSVPVAAGIGALTGVLTRRKDEDILGAAVMGGLSGFGGANLASGLANAGAATGTELLPGVTGAEVGQTVATDPNLLGANYLAGDVPNTMVSTPIGQGGLGLGMSGAAPAGTELAQAAPSFSQNLSNAGQGVKGLFQDGGFDRFRQGLNPGGDMVSTPKAAMAIGMPALTVAGGISDMMAPKPEEAMTPEEEEEYKGLYLYGPKSLESGLRLANGGTVAKGGLMDLYGTADGQPSQNISASGYGLGRLSNLAREQSMSAAQMGQYAEGGSVKQSVPMLEEGGFVIPTDVVNMAGGQDNDMGQRAFMQKYNGVPIKGPGDGYSDSIPTSIDGVQPARVANGEVYIPAAVVEQYGGPKKFYALMNQVRKQATGSTKQLKPAEV
jgi:hypothetical protein